MNADISCNLIRLRVEHGHTQEYVANNADISLPTYRNIESGKSIPSIPTLNKIAKFYQIDCSDLLKNSDMELKTIRFRALKKSKIKKREEILYEVSAWAKNYNELITKLKIENDFIFKLSNIKETNPIKLAAKVRKELGLSSNEVVKDLSNLIEFKAGIKILAKQFNSDGFFGLSAEDKYGSKIIVVNTWDRISIERKIFSIAHELGHILLHFNSEQEELLVEDENEENQANQFASHFLMPQEDFIAEWNKYSDCDFVEKVLRTKQNFKVSYQVVLFRLDEYIKKHKIKTVNVWRLFNVLYARKYNVRHSRLQEINSLDENSLEFKALSGNFYAGSKYADTIKKALENNLIDKKQAAQMLDTKETDIDKFEQSWEKIKLYHLS